MRLQGLALLAAAASLLHGADPADFFEKQVRPVLAERCYACHGPDRQASSLRVDSRDALLKGGARGPAIVPGDPGLSLLARAVRHDGLKMPQGASKLEDAQIAAIETWIREGAPWPARGGVAESKYDRIRREHWAFQPVKPPAPSATIDGAVRRALVAAHLEPAPRASREVLIRRLSFVLTGLPPTPLEVSLFVRDSSPGAYERLVDRLLASPHFGEHWARHWMDVMRFAETYGNDWNYENKGAWLYRDYLIRAFNNDVPYDQLVREHLAGDLLAKPRIDVAGNVNESVLGTASFRMGEIGHDDCIRFRQIRTDVVDNQIDTVGKAFQGLTISCARCHDHKLDPIPTSDYYGMYGVLTSSRMVMRNADTPEINASAKRRLRELKPQIQKEVARLWLEETPLTARYLTAAYRAWKGEAPGAENPPIARVEAWLKQLEKNNAPMEDPLYPMRQALDFDKVRESYVAESQKRAAFNRENFRPFGDPARDGFGGWNADGNVAADGPSAAGDFAIAPTGPTALTAVFAAGLYTNTLSQRLNGALRSPYAPKDRKFVSLLVSGGELAAWRTVLDNCMLSEDYTTLNSDAPKWIKIPNRTDQKALPFYVELVTKWDNPRIPDRPGRLKATQAQIDSADSWFGIERAVMHDVDETPRDELSHMARLFAQTVASTPEAFAKRYAEVAERAIRAWAEGKATNDDARWIEWLVSNRLISNTADASPKLRDLIEEYRFAESRLKTARTFNGMADFDPGYNFPILPYGDAENPGRTVPRGFLQLISGGGEGIAAFGSGRLELAEMIASPANPLTARVMANRVWQNLLGRGIVATADNFGTYGEAPSNQELLDLLATKFVEQGWSVKKLIRMVALSETFQAANASSDAARTADPLDRLFSHYPVHRLEGESIRDAMLAVSGRLDRTMYGPSIQPHREQPKDYRKLFQGPLDGDGRRSIYVKVTRHEGSRFLETFDFPNPNVTRGNRDSTNVPPQALALLNDPFVLDQAAVWADRLILEGAPVETRIERMFHEALGRAPAENERARFLSLEKELASLHKVADPAKVASNRDVWKDMAHAVFNLKEFIYVQ